MAKLTPGEKAARAMRSQYEAIAHKLRYQYKECGSWSGAESRFGITLPPAVHERPFDYANVSFVAIALPSILEKERERKLTADIQTAHLPIIRDPTLRPKFGDFQLMPEQQAPADKLFDEVVHYLEHREADKTCRAAILNDGKTGSGKTYVAAYIIWRLYNEGIVQKYCPFPFANVLVITPKSVQEQYKRALLSAGLGQYYNNLLSSLMVLTYSQLKSNYGKMLFVEEQRDFVTDEVILSFKPQMRPLFVVADESHKLQSFETQQTKILWSMVDCDMPPFVLAMSATPYRTINSARFLVQSMRNVDFDGLRVTNNNWQQIAGLLADKPDKPNKAAAKRLRNMLVKSGNIVSFPPIKWDVKSRIYVKLYDFETEKDIEIYRTSEERWVDACRKMGKSPTEGPFRACIALQQHKLTAEPMRTPAIAREIAACHKSGSHAPVFFCEFRESLIRCMRELVITHGIPRDEISVIWGGRRKLRKDRLLDKDQIQDLTSRIVQGNFETWELRALEETIRFESDAIRHGELNDDGTVDLSAQAARHAELETLGVGSTQSSIERQTNIDNFQSGKTRICLATIAAGGIGLSLDQDKPHLLPRKGWLSLIYSGVNFLQAAGRMLRRATVGVHPVTKEPLDVEIILAALRGTVEETHVAPTLDQSLACIALSAGSINPMNIMTNIAKTYGTTTAHPALRTMDQVIKDSESIESQPYAADDLKSDEEDDEDNDE